ncbi:MAG: GyrI-like domain-containing protein [Flavobacteriales bacterium]|nr:GyrI-like domain-containing protein [Flavobacteriales bacterium]
MINLEANLKLKKMPEWLHQKIEIKNVPDQPVATVPCQGVQGLPSGFDTLIDWAGPKGLMGPDTKMATEYVDSFKDTPANEVRMNACLVLTNQCERGEKVYIDQIEGGKNIVGSFEIKPNQFQQAWEEMFQWMKDHNYKKDVRNPFEIYHNNFNEHPEGIAFVDLYVPIKAI